MLNQNSSSEISYQEVFKYFQNEAVNRKGLFKDKRHFLLVTDRIVVVGNHHDAWVMGAIDPSSGSAILMEVVRAVGLAMKKGNF